MEFLAFILIVALLAFWPRQFTRFVCVLILVCVIPFELFIAWAGAFSTSVADMGWQKYAALMIGGHAVSSLALLGLSWAIRQPLNALQIAIVAVLFTAEGAGIYYGGELGSQIVVGVFAFGMLILWPASMVIQCVQDYMPKAA